MELGLLGAAELLPVIVVVAVIEAANLRVLEKSSRRHTMTGFSRRACDLRTNKDRRHRACARQLFGERLAMAAGDWRRVVFQGHATMKAQRWALGK
jgi:hypothetical protein